MNPKKPILFLVLLAVFTVQLAQGQTDDIATLTKAAEQGNAHAQVVLGGMYDLGRGVTKDEVEAIKWYWEGIPHLERRCAPVPERRNIRYRYCS